MADNERKEGNAEEDKVNPGEETGLIDTAIKDEKITQNNMDKGSKKRKTAQKSRAVNKKSSVKRNNPPKESMKDKAVSKKVEVSEEVDTNQLGVLTESLLSTGEDMSKLLIATKSLADRLKNVTNNYTELVNNYVNLIKKKDKHLLYLMASSIGLIIISLAVVVVMSFSFSKQVNNMNALSVSLTKRITEVNSGLVTFEELNGSIRSLDESTLQLAQQVEAQQKTVQDIVVQTGNNTREQIDQLKQYFSGQNDAMSSTLTALEKESQNQQYYINQNSTAVQGLGAQLELMSKSIAELTVLKNSVEALVILERERYLEAIQSKSTDTVQSANLEEGVITFYKTQN